MQFAQIESSSKVSQRMAYAARLKALDQESNAWRGHRFQSAAREQMCLASQNVLLNRSVICKMIYLIK